MQGALERERNPNEDPLSYLLMNDTLTVFKNTYSTILLIFSIVIICGLIFEEKTAWSEDAHPAVAMILLFAAVLWLSMVEGGQASLVGLAPVPSEIFKDSHPKSYMCCSICHAGDNLERYLMGRQFMVLALVFVINNCGAPVADAELWGMPDWVTVVFLETGWAMILFTCMVGQLNTQVNASHCMLDYINNYFAVFTFWVTMIIEFSGLLHSSYFVQILVAAASGKNIQSFEPPRTPMGSGFFWLRVYMSMVILCFCLAVIVQALYNGQTTVWDGLPETVALLLFIILLSVVGLLEGMQIAFFAVAKLPASERGDTKFAKWTCELLFRGEGENLPGFMIGRQLCVVSCFFVIARVTTYSIDDDEKDPVFGLGEGWQEFFKTGLQGAIVTTIIGSISWQLVASAFPIPILSFPGTYILLRWCLFLEATGIANGAYVIAWVHKNIKGFKRDEEYIGTAEERVASGAHQGLRSNDQALAVATRKTSGGDQYDEFAADKQFEQPATTQQGDSGRKVDDI